MSTKTEAFRFVRLTVAGAAQVQKVARDPSSCFPFNCVRRRANTGTNTENCMRRAYNLASLTTWLRDMATLEELADRVERLLLRFEELSRTQQLVQAQLASVTQERDSLKSRLNAARSRVDTLLDRLPTGSFAAESVATESLTTQPAPIGTGSLGTEPQEVTPPGPRS